MTDTIGAQLTQPDPLRGWLAFDHLPADMQTVEDTTRWADVRERRQLVRPATPVELLLLAHLGYDTSPVTQTCVRGTYRYWPVLDPTSITDSHWKLLHTCGYTDA